MDLLKKMNICKCKNLKKYLIRFGITLCATTIGIFAYFEIDGYLNKQYPTRNDISINAIEKVRPAIVHITIKKMVFTPRWFYDSKINNAYKPEAISQKKFKQLREKVAYGSGVVVDSYGHVITNYHVIDGAHNVEIRFIDGRIYEAEIIGAEEDIDLVLLQITTTTHEFEYVKIGSSKDVRVGEKIFALGYPLGLGLTITAIVVELLLI